MAYLAYRRITWTKGSLGASPALIARWRFACEETNTDLCGSGAQSGHRGWCSSARGDEPKSDDRASSSGDTVTIAGCLSTGADGRFALDGRAGRRRRDRRRSDGQRARHAFLRAHRRRQSPGASWQARRGGRHAERQDARYGTRSDQQDRSGAGSQRQRHPDGEDQGRHRYPSASAECSRSA